MSESKARPDEPGAAPAAAAGEPSITPSPPSTLTPAVRVQPPSRARGLGLIVASIGISSAMLGFSVGYLAGPGRVARAPAAAQPFVIALEPPRIEWPSLEALVAPTLPPPADRECDRFGR